MATYAFRRVLHLIPLLLGVTVVLFAVIQAAPGGPEAALLSSGRPVTPEVLEEYRERLGVDRPIPVQYVRWLGEALRGNLGLSFTTSRPVSEVILERLPATVELMGAAFLLSAILALAVGTLGAVRPHSWLDGRTPNEVYFGRRAANRRPRIEPRRRWPRGSPCAGPQTLVAGQPGDRFNLHVDYHAGRRHLPIVTLKRAA